MLYKKQVIRGISFPAQAFLLFTVCLGFHGNVFIHQHILVVPCRFIIHPPQVPEFNFLLFHRSTKVSSFIFAAMADVMNINTDEQEGSEELYERFSFSIDKGQEPYRIDKFLMNRIENATRNKLQRAINAGLVLVNGKEVKQNY